MELRHATALSGPAPAIYGPVPAPRQLAWHELEFYGFLHFTVNTFTGLEWGYGDESPSIFAPTGFDSGQIASVAKAGGMAGLILTCKHHDGFCLWPSRYTDHSVKSSRWRGGKGDVVGEVGRACAEAGLRFGVYLSPWDRNHAAYAGAEYVVYYRNQLRELLTEFGPLFEVWFDGANGGDGYYGGAREKRSIDAATYYEWERTWELVRELQPDACMFSSEGPDLRWVGNEKGIAGDPCWHTIGSAPLGSGEGARALLNSGARFEASGAAAESVWRPAECDVSIRPGWFYHAGENERVRSPADLMDLYYRSVGRGASLLLNLPPDRRGVVHERDAESLSGFRRRREATFGTNLAEEAKFTVSSSRGDTLEFAPTNLLDPDPERYWAPEDSAKEVEIIVELPRPATFNLVELCEYLPLGQRVDSYRIEVEIEGRLRLFAEGRGIGHRRVAHGERCSAKRITIVLRGPVCPAIRALGVYHDAEL